MSSILSKLINLAGNITGILSTANGGTGSATIGTANQVLGVNSGASALEYKTLTTGTSGSDFGIANTANTVTFNLPDAGASARGAVTTGTQTLAGSKTFSSAVTISAAATNLLELTNTSASANGFLGVDSTYALNVMETTNGDRVFGVRQDQGGIIFGGNSGVASAILCTGASMDLNMNAAGTVRINRGSPTGSDFQVLRAGTATVDFRVTTSGLIGVNTTSWSTGGTAVGVSSGFLTTSPSSRRYKTNIQPLANEIDSSKIWGLRPVTFDYTHNGRHSFGYIAEDVCNVLPCLVNYEVDPDTQKPRPESVSYDHLSLLILEELRKLKADFDAYKASHP